MTETAKEKIYREALLKIGYLNDDFKPKGFAKYFEMAQAAIEDAEQLPDGAACCRYASHEAHCKLIDELHERLDQLKKVDKVLYKATKDLERIVNATDKYYYNYEGLVYLMQEYAKQALAEIGGEDE